FAAEIDEQRRLLARAAAGERGLAQVSAVAMEAAHEANQTYGQKPELDDRTDIDLLPPLGDDSGPAPFIDEEPTTAELDEDTDNAATNAASPLAKRPTGANDVITSPRGVPAHDPPAMARPLLHYLLAGVIVVGVALLVYFLLRR